MISFGNNMGASQYNGNAAFSLDNSIWDANSYSISGIPTQKPAAAKWRANVSFGGPLKIPHLLSGKNSTFILNYSMGRTRNSSTQTYTVPTALERAGDFSQSVVQTTQGTVPVTLYDPKTHVPVPGNKLLPGSISAAAQTLASYYPMPNAPGSRLNYQTALVNISNTDNLNARLNHTIGKNDRISGSLGWQRSDGSGANYLGFLDSNSNYGINASASWAHTFSKRLVQNVSLNFSRSRTELSPYFANLNQNVAQQLGIQGTSALPQNFGPPALGFTNFSGLSDGNAQLSRNQTTSLSYSINLVRTKHQWTFGADYRRQQINPFSDSNGRGSFGFTGAATAALDGTGGYDFADLLLGLPTTANIRFGNADKYFRTWKLDGYISDNWNLSRAITANLGVRWDYTAPYTELYNRMANLEIGPGFTPAATAAAGKSGKSSSLIEPYYAAVSPSFGISWRPFYKNPKMPTQVRFGIGMQHPADTYGAISSQLAAQPPFARTLSIASTPQTPLSLQTAFLNTPPFAATYAVDPNYKLLSVTQAQLLVIQPLPQGFYVVAGVVGAVASHLDQSMLPNSLPPLTSLPVNGPPVGYQYQQASGNVRASVKIFQIGRQMSSGITASLTMQLARATDNGSVSVMSGGGGLAQNWQDLRSEKATSGLVPQAQLNGNWQYSTGQGKLGGALMSGWKGRLFKDWTFTNGFTWRAGTPLTATVGGVRSTVGGTGISGTIRADATGVSIDPLAGSTLPFNPAAFAVPGAGRWGNAGRNTIIGPAIWGLNASVGRVFRLGERRSVDLRFDANNVINHVVYNGWYTVINAYNVGLPTGTQPMRSMTANLRFRF
jgi:hypothetical protein